MPAKGKFGKVTTTEKYNARGKATGMGQAIIKKSGSVKYQLTSARRAALKKAQAASAAARRKLSPSTNALRVKMAAQRAAKRLSAEGRVAGAIFRKSGLKGVARYAGKRAGIGRGNSSKSNPTMGPTRRPRRMK